MRIRELDNRSADGIEVSLFWDAATGSVFVTVADERLGSSFRFEVDPADALEAFRHPYVYGLTAGAPAQLAA